MDLVALSSGHAFGLAQCRTFIGTVYNFDGRGNPYPFLNTIYLATLHELCPQGGNGSVLTQGQMISGARRAMAPLAF
ncbi:hypothetical protein SLE2022_190860 [Rubroshorea leprosula]